MSDYAPFDGLLGQLQRGRGAGARTVADDPAAESLVMDCVRHDWRWEWQVDDRPGYLARLVRDLGLPSGPIGEQLETEPPEAGNDFDVAARILSMLALIGDETARAGIDRYIAQGPHWVDALEIVVDEWPAEQWRRYAETALARLDPPTIDRLFPAGKPWATWETMDPRLAEAFTAWRSRSDRHTGDGLRPGLSTDRLLALLRDPDMPRAAKVAALRRLTELAPPPELLDLAEGLVHVVRELGRSADTDPLSPARPRRTRTGHRSVCPALVGRTGAPARPDRSESPRRPRRRRRHTVLAAEFARLRDQGEWCRYDTLTDGLIRLGVAEAPGSETATWFRRELRCLWQATPHSYERTSYLRALVALDGPTTHPSFWRACGTARSRSDCCRSPRFPTPHRPGIGSDS
ncbi:hypothetical protein LX16_4708 [Stackebrandtia albiflava]|uniref:Uncharacterized protein n=1 Tax=Stackebrandtia albiflava TaxID=406432 RepID=A0A562UQM0_9ACTN|nr:hypothetical protein [Stackebrandtia albiflava]TWJ07925.1 hypothetical protein LX16_4708 [Stackebrandtia albiflava]